MRLSQSLKFLVFFSFTANALETAKLKHSYKCGCENSGNKKSHPVLNGTAS